MATYEMMKQDPPAYGQPGEGYQQQGAYLEPVPATGPANLQPHDQPPPSTRRNFFQRRTRTDEDGAENNDEDDTMDPGDTCIPEKALDVSKNTGMLYR